MQVDQLLVFIKNLVEAGTKHQYPALINQLRTTITQYKNQRTTGPTSAQTGQLRNSVITQANNAVRIIGSIFSEIRDYDLLKKFSGVADRTPFGESARTLFDRIPRELEPPALDSLINDLNQYSQKLTSYLSVATALNTVLTDFNGTKEVVEIDQLVIHFENEASVANLKDLSKVSTEWGHIVNWYARVAKDTNTDVKIVEIRKGSLIAYLAISPPILLILIRIANKILDLILKHLEVKRKIEELRQLKMEGLAKGIELIEKESTLNLPQQAKLLVADLMKEYGWHHESGDYHEVKSAAIKATKQLIKFHSQGGKVDCKLTDPNEEQRKEATLLKDQNVKFLIAEMELKTLTGQGQTLKIEEGDPDDQAGTLTDTNSSAA